MKRVLQADLADELSKDLIAGNFIAGDTIYADVGEGEAAGARKGAKSEMQLVFSKDPFPPEEPASEVDEEAAAEAKAVLAEKAKAAAKAETEAATPSP